MVKRKKKPNYGTIKKNIEHKKECWIKDIYETEERVIQRKINDEQFGQELEHIREQYLDEIDELEKGL